MTTVTEMVITEIRRGGDGTVEDGPAVFKFTSREHSSPQNDLQLHLQLTTSRKSMPGSDTVVEHVMSATWQPFDLSGEWDDKWANRISTNVSRELPYAMTMYLEFSKFVSRMPFVRLQIDSLSFLGILTDLKMNYRTASKIAWTVTVSPHVNETVALEKPRVRVSQSIPKWISNVDAQGLKLNSSMEKMRLSPLKTPRVDVVTARLVEVNDALDRLDRLGGATITSFQNEPLADQVGRYQLLASTFRRVAEAGRSMYSSLKSVKSPDDESFEDAINSLAHVEWRADMISISFLMICEANAAALDMEERAKQPPKAVYYPRRNEHLEKISLNFYGTADNWRQIYIRNSLQSVVMRGDEELLIPKMA